MKAELRHGAYWSAIADLGLVELDMSGAAWCEILIAAAEMLDWFAGEGWCKPLVQALEKSPWEPKRMAPVRDYELWHRPRELPSVRVKLMPEGWKRPVVIRVFRPPDIYFFAQPSENRRFLFAGSRHESAGSRRLSVYTAMAKAYLAMGLQDHDAELVEAGYPAIPVVSREREYLRPADHGAVDFCRALLSMQSWPELREPLAFIKDRLSWREEKMTYIAIGQYRWIVPERLARVRMHGKNIWLPETVIWEMEKLGIPARSEELLPFFDQLCENEHVRRAAIETRRKTGKWPWQVELETQKRK